MFKGSQPVLSIQHKRILLSLASIFLVIPAKAWKIFKIHLKNGSHGRPDHFWMENINRRFDDGKIRNPKTNAASDNRSQITHIARIHQNHMVFLVIQTTVIFPEYAYDNAVVFVTYLFNTSVVFYYLHIRLFAFLRKLIADFCFRI